MSEYLNAAAGIASVGASIYSLTKKPPAIPQVNAGGSSGLRIGFATPLTTPGYGFSEGNLFKSPAGEAFANAQGGFLAGGGFDALRNRQVGQALSGLPGQRAALGGALTSIGDLRAQVKPGFGALTDARVTAIRDAAAESIGNLRESLAKRQVMGSSFADDAVSRTRIAYAREEQSARAEAKLAEIGVQGQLIEQELNTYARALGLDQFEASVYQQDIANAVLQSNLISQEMTRQLQEFGIAGNIANSVSATVTQQGIAQAQLQLLSSVQSGKDSAGALAGLTSGLKDLGKLDFSKIF